MDLAKMRKERGWSQEHIASLSGLSVRTIQRLEKGETPSLESLQALAVVFETTVATLQAPTPQSALILQRQAFCEKALSFGSLWVFLLVINLFTSEYLWAIWPGLAFLFVLLRSGLKLLIMQRNHTP